MKAVAWAVFQKGSLNNYKSEKSRWGWMKVREVVVKEPLK